MRRSVARERHAVSIPCRRLAAPHQLRRYPPLNVLRPRVDEGLSSWHDLLSQSPPPAPAYGSTRTTNSNGTAATTCPPPPPPSGGHHGAPRRRLGIRGCGLAVLREAAYLRNLAPPAAAPGRPEAGALSSVAAKGASGPSPSWQEEVRDESSAHNGNDASQAAHAQAPWQHQPAAPAVRVPNTSGLTAAALPTPAATASPPLPPSNDYFYSVARTDRAGVSILDMVSALAYGYAKNLTYGGACYRKAMTLDAPRRQADKLALIRAIGLQDLLVFACPPPSRRHLIVPRARYYDNRYSLMTPKFIDWLRSKSTAVSPQATAVPGGSAIVHVRRGDVDPCRQWKDRYLPSSYYLDVLDRYVPAGVPVTVFSEAASFEPWTDFGGGDKATAAVRLDTDVAEVWGAVMAASHVVLSRSSFAYVPALLNANNATVIYPSRWPVVVPPRGWKQADPDIQERSERRVKQLAKERCHNYTSVKTGRSYFNASRRRRRLR